MIEGNSAFRECFDRVVHGLASSQEKIDFLFLLADVSRDQAPRSVVEALTTDLDEEVRLYALQTLVLDLKFKDEQSAELCWQALDRDPDDLVRGMGAACLGSIFFGSFRDDIVRRLREYFVLEGKYPGLQWALLDSMRALVGLSPESWKVPRDVLRNRSPESHRLGAIESALARKT